MLLVLGGQAHDGPHLLLCQASGPRRHHQQQPDSSSSSRSGRGVYRRHTGEEEAAAVAVAQAAQSSVDSLSGSLTVCPCLQFIGGAGKFFEGSPADMFGSLYHKLVGGLPPDTLVYCGHEVSPSLSRSLASHARS